MKSTRAKKASPTVENSETQINTTEPPKSEEASNVSDSELDQGLDSDVTLPKGKPPILIIQLL